MLNNCSIFEIPGLYLVQRTKYQLFFGHPRSVAGWYNILMFSRLLNISQLERYELINHIITGFIVSLVSFGHAIVLMITLK